MIRAPHAPRSTRAEWGCSSIRGRNSATARFESSIEARNQQSNSGVFVRIDDGILSRIGEKTHGVQREKDGQLSPEMVSRMKEASEKQLGAWYAVHHGFEVQINDAGDSWHRTGAIYSLAEAAALPAKPTI